MKMESNEVKRQVRGTKSMIVALVGMVIFSLVTFIFAYTQRLDAKRQRELSVRLKEELVEMEKIAEQNRKEAIVERLRAEESERMAVKTLEECKQNQKK